MTCQMKTVVMPKHLMSTSKPKQIWAKTLTVHSALEMEAATALLMLRYQYDVERKGAACSTTELPMRPPTPPAPAAAQHLNTVAADKCTPKEQVRSSSITPVQPLKKRSIPPHLLRRCSLTPAKSRISSNHNNSAGSSYISGSNIIKAKQKVHAPNRQGTCTKALLKSCRNMIREFLDNQELV